MTTAHVLFLDPDGLLLPLFAEEAAGYDMAFFVNGADSEWCIAAGVCDGDGEPQAWLEHIRSGPEHSFFLGAEPQQAMRAACRLIAKWESAGTGSKPN